MLLVTSGSRRVVSWLGGYSPVHGSSVGVVFVVDRISAGLATLIAALVTAALVYTWRYFDEVEGYFHALLLLFLAGMVGFALTGDLFDAFVFFELMGAVAYALTGYKIEEAKPLQGALNFAVINSLGAYSPRQVPDMRHIGGVAELAAKELDIRGEGVEQEVCM